MADAPKSMPGRRSAAAAAAVRDWSRYFDAVADAGPRETLLDAADRFKADRMPEPPRRFTAIDFGCGTGRDTIELLERGWCVIAMDGEQEAIDRMLARPELETHVGGEQLECRLVTFDGVAFPSCDLFNSSYTLPFCPPALFGNLWPRIVAAIRPGGRFAGQLFGDQDDWAGLPDRTHHTRAQVAELFRDFEVENLGIDLYGPKPESAYPKRWHVFHVVARKLDRACVADDYNRLHGREGII